MYVRAYPRETQEMLFDAHARAFAFFGGVPTRGIYDNMKTAVTSVFTGKERVFNRRFLVMAGVIMVVNAGAGLIGLAPGAEGARVAWEAHAFGFIAGALLIGPWVKVFRSRRTSFASPPDLGDPSA